MIGRLRGKIVYSSENYAILEPGNGVGYKINILADTAIDLTKKTLEETTFWIEDVTREDSHELYGFLEEIELNYFRLLMSVSGIGPKKALAILSIAPPETLRKAVVSGNSKYLTNVSGIGPKNAEKIIIELRDKLSSKTTDTGMALNDDSDVIEAVKSLGYSAAQAREAIKNIKDDITDVGQRVKETLKILGKNTK
ncbi:MAG: Holliday junction branch migration protein RuvA [Candidatus Paceibacterota bacterium]|jgi:Holliday junction DNA helicase RuvA